MSKRDYIAIAHVLDANVAPLALVMDFADMLGEDNERFDRVLFIEASTKNLGKQQEHEALMLALATTA